MRKPKVRPGTSLRFWREINRATTQVAADSATQLVHHEMVAKGISYREVLNQTNMTAYDTRPVSF